MDVDGETAGEGVVREAIAVCNLWFDVWRFSRLIWLLIKSQEVMVKILYGFVAYIDYFVGQELEGGGGELKANRSMGWYI